MFLFHHAPDWPVLMACVGALRTFGAQRRCQPTKALRDSRFFGFHHRPNRTLQGHPYH